MIKNALSPQKVKTSAVLALVAAAGALVGISTAAYGGDSTLMHRPAVPTYVAASAEPPATGVSMEAGFSSVVQKAPSAVVNISSTRVV